MEAALNAEKAAKWEEALARQALPTPKAPIGQATPQSRPRIEDTPMTAPSTSPDEPPSAQRSATDADQAAGDDAEMEAAEDQGEMFTFPSGLKLLSHDALRMRLKRLCEVKAKSKKCHVDAKTREQYEGGGEGREWLEIALVEALDKVGACGLRNHKQVKAPLAASAMSICSRTSSVSPFPFYSNSIYCDLHCPLSLWFLCD